MYHAMFIKFASKFLHLREYFFAILVFLSLSVPVPLLIFPVFLSSPHHIDDNQQQDDNSSDLSAHKPVSPLQSRSAVLSMYKALELQARAHRELLIGRVHSQLTHLLTNSLGGGGSGAVVGDVSATGTCISFYIVKSVLF